MMYIYLFCCFINLR